MIRDTSKKLPRVDPDKVAEALGAERRGYVRAGSGYFAAARLAAVFAQEVQPDAPPQAPKAP